MFLALIIVAYSGILGSLMWESYLASWCKIGGSIHLPTCTWNNAWRDTLGLPASEKAGKVAILPLQCQCDSLNLNKRLALLFSEHNMVLEKVKKLQSKLEVFEEKVIRESSFIKMYMAIPPLKLTLLELKLISLCHHFIARSVCT